MSGANLSDAEAAFVARARRAVLATLGPNGEPRLMPICVVLADRPDGLGRPIAYSPLDEKPKASADPRALGRVRDLLAHPSVTLLVDRWSEAWEQLGWIRLSGRATLLEPDMDQRRADQPGADRPATDQPGEHNAAIAALRAKYPQYATHDLEHRPVIRIAIERVVRWGNVEPDEPAAEPAAEAAIRAG